MENGTAKSLDGQPARVIKSSSLMGKLVPLFHNSVALGRTDLKGFVMQKKTRLSLVESSSLDDNSKSLVGYLPMKL